jgi:peptide deformylase
MKIITIPHKILRTRCRSVSVDDNIKELQSIAHDMWLLMKQHQGIGLAAPQVNINLRMFIMDPDIDNDVFDPASMIFMNPKVRHISGYENSIEGCLSVPGKTYTIKRLKTIALYYRGHEFQKAYRIFTVPKSIIIQHETDHLDGKLIERRSEKIMTIPDCNYSPTLILMPDHPVCGKAYSVSAGYYLNSVEHERKDHVFMLTIWHGSDQVFQDIVTVPTEAGTPLGYYPNIVSYQGLAVQPIKVELLVSCKNTGKVLSAIRQCYPLALR